MSVLAGIDIGGTKCAVSLNECTAEGVKTLGRVQFPTPLGPTAALAQLIDALGQLMTNEGVKPSAIGVSAGGPLSVQRGVLLGPPNLPGWDEVDVVTPFRERFGVPTALENDANAGALAEWYWGAGQGLRNMVFLTFGTGMGAGLILNGALYRGTTDLAGEVGHVRLAASGPLGFGKYGSFEGFCSGGGIARWARERWEEGKLAGDDADVTSSRLATLASSGELTAEHVGQAALDGNALAISLLHESGRRLGQALALIVDMLNPELIVIGSIYSRLSRLLEPSMREVLKAEALPAALAACRIEPAGLGERVGDLASVAVALAAMAPRDPAGDGRP